MELITLEGIESSGPSKSLGQKQAVEAIPQNLRVPLPRNNSQEIRSYNFFLDVTAPTITGVFDVDFWLAEIPRTCHSDPAIWHAVVSLGAVHENYVSRQGAVNGGATPMFAIQQFNAAVRHLIHLPSSRTPLEDKRRALTASVLFVYLCSIQGLHFQSIVHLAAAKNLIKEAKEGMEAAAPEDANAVTPLFFGSLPSIVANLDIQSHTLQSSTAHVAPSFLNGIDAYMAWKHYRTPVGARSSSLCQHGRCDPSRATNANLASAGRAFESLLNALVALSQHNATEVARLVLGGEHDLLATLINRQKPYVCAFRELDAAIAMFVQDTRDCLCLASSPSSTPCAPKVHGSQRRAINSLRLFHAVCYPLLLEKPALALTVEDGTSSSVIFHPLLPDGAPSRVASAESAPIPPPDPEATLTKHFTRMLENAESILQDNAPPTRTSAADFTPMLPTTIPLLTMAHTGGLPRALRRRAISLLRRYPRCEGLWDSSLAAALADAVMQREFPSSENRGEDDEEVKVPAASSKVHGVGLTFTGAHSARVTMQTWAEWIANVPGQEGSLTW
jgi:hypothetical protein